MVKRARIVQKAKVMPVVDWLTIPHHLYGCSCEVCCSCSSCEDSRAANTVPPTIAGQMSYMDWKRLGRANELALPKSDPAAQAYENAWNQLNDDPHGPTQLLTGMVIVHKLDAPNGRPFQAPTVKGLVLTEIGYSGEEARPTYQRRPKKKQRVVAGLGKQIITVTADENVPNQVGMVRKMTQQYRDQWRH